MRNFSKQLLDGEIRQGNIQISYDASGGVWAKPSEYRHKKGRRFEKTSYDVTMMTNASVQQQTVSENKQN